jgi:hypothetical protein
MVIVAVCHKGSDEAAIGYLDACLGPHFVLLRYRGKHADSGIGWSLYRGMFYPQLANMVVHTVQNPISRPIAIPVPL